MTIRLHRGADAEISTGLLLPKVVRALLSELRVGLRKCTNLVKLDWTSTSSVDFPVQKSLSLSRGGSGVPDAAAEEN